MSEASLILYKWPGAWGLPSCSPACVQAEAYLRFAGVAFQAQACSTTSKSPSGQLPAVEHEADVSATGDDDFVAARAAIALARKAKDLDGHMSTSQKAELLAFGSLIEHKLDVATQHMIWCERQGYAEYTKAAFKDQPWPINYFIPAGISRTVARKHAGMHADQVYHDAGEVLSAFAERLRSSPGRYLLGERPCSLDALLFGHLLFYRSSPAAAPMLHQKVTSTQVLVDYMDHILSTAFHGSSVGVEASASGSTSSSQPKWSEAAKGAPRPTKPRELTAAEKEFRRKSWMWLAGAGAVVAAYILFSGRYIDLDTLAQALGQAGDDDDDDDGGDEDDHDGGDE